MESSFFYVIVKEPEIPFCRVRRSDSFDIAGFDILWSGYDLREAYDEMIRINRLRKINTWSVYFKPSTISFVVKKDDPMHDRRWKRISTHTEYKEAFLSAKEWKLWLEITIQSILKKANVDCNGEKPKMSKADKRYIIQSIEKTLEKELGIQEIRE